MFFTDLAFQFFSRFQLYIPVQRSKSLLWIMAAHDKYPYPRVQQRPADGLCPHGPGLAAALGPAVCRVQRPAVEELQLLGVCLPRIPSDFRPACHSLLFCDFFLTPLKKQKEPYGEGLRSSNARLQGLFRLTAQRLFVSSYNTPARRCLFTVSRGIPGFRSEELPPHRLRHNSTSTGILQPLPLHHSSSPFASAP